MLGLTFRSDVIVTRKSGTSCAHHLMLLSGQTSCWSVTCSLAYLSRQKTATSEGDDRDLNSRMSSAYTRSDDPSDSWTLNMSFMKTKNNRGPKIEPWGTPDLAGSHDDSAPLKMTR